MLFYSEYPVWGLRSYPRVAVPLLTSHGSGGLPDSLDAVPEGVAFFQCPDQQGAKEVLYFLELSLGEGRLSLPFCHFCFLGGMNKLTAHAKPCENISSSSA